MCGSLANLERLLFDMSEKTCGIMKQARIVKTDNRKVLWDTDPVLFAKAVKENGGSAVRSKRRGNMAA